MTRALSALAVAALLTLVGCAPAAPAAEPSVAPSVAEPSSTPAPDPVVDTIIFRAESIELVGDGQVLAVLEIDGSTEAAIESLTEVIGAPEYSLVPPGECNDEFDQYLWPNVMVINSPGRPLGSFNVRVFAADSPGVEGESVQLQGPAGEQVGDDLSAFIAATNPALVETFLTSDIVLLDVGWLSSGFTAGVAAFADGGIVDNMGVPIAVNSGLDC